VEGGCHPEPASKASGVEVAQSFCAIPSASEGAHNAETLHFVQGGRQAAVSRGILLPRDLLRRAKKRTITAAKMAAARFFAFGSDIHGSVGPATLHESGNMSVIPVSRSPEPAEG
jgi:hypothetical protein